jgi:hypothetical protein
MLVKAALSTSVSRSAMPMRRGSHSPGRYESHGWRSNQLPLTGWAKPSRAGTPSRPSRKNGRAGPRDIK